MTVGELKLVLGAFDDDDLVVLSDEEGNWFSPLLEVEPSSYDSATQQAGLRELTDELRYRGFSENDVIDGVSSVTLWP